jgi:mono/diheme cytochrome c family protein
MVRMTAGAFLAMTCGVALSAEPVGAGEVLFKQHCAACHQADGAGVPGLAPALAQALGRHLASPRVAEYFTQVLVAGLAGPIASGGQSFNSAMPAVSQLTDDEIAAILNFVARALNGAAEDRVTPADVVAARRRGAGPTDSLRLRRVVLGGQP